MSKFENTLRPLMLATLAALAALLTGCATPGAPQPPSLHLPEKVSDLSAVRSGDTVTLAWTTPQRNTDKLLMKDPIVAQICRASQPELCERAGEDRMLSPGAPGAFHERLSAALSSGAPRPLLYFVELRNHAGRSAGRSNAAVVLAGKAPSPVEGLRAEIRKDGAALRWTSETPTETIRIVRQRLSPPAKRETGLLAAPAEPARTNLLIEASPRPGATLDRGVRFGQSYEYRAQRIVRVTLEGKRYELASELSAPVRLTAEDIFPPEPPTALAAVANLAPNTPALAIDLSWRPVEEANLAGYLVYRQEAGSPWRRISPPEPLLGPSYHDEQVEAGHAYRYAVSALGRNGRESARSPEAAESLPATQPAP